MSKSLIIITILIMNQLCYAQKGEAILILKDSTRVEGFGEISGLSSNVSVKFKNDSLKYRTYSHKEIIGLDLKENEYYRMFRYKNTDKSKYPELLEIISNGKLSLYVKIFGNGILSKSPLSRRLDEYFGVYGNTPDDFEIPGINSPPASNNFVNMAYLELEFDRVSYYIGHKGSDKAGFLFSSGLPFSKGFKKAMKDKFMDCPSLIEKVENKEFKKKDIILAIYYYNSKCL